MAAIEKFDGSEGKIGNRSTLQEAFTGALGTEVVMWARLVVGRKS